jgi:protein O-GlcNAc transferase
MNRKQHRAAAKQPHAELASAFSQALALHQAGRLAEAEKIYGQILKGQPNHFDSLHLLGVIFSQRGNHAEAVRQIEVALKINPKAASAHSNRGNERAANAWRRLMRLRMRFNCAIPTAA